MAMEGNMEFLEAGHPLNSIFWSILKGTFLEEISMHRPWHSPQVECAGGRVLLGVKMSPRVMHKWKVKSPQARNRTGTGPTDTFQFAQALSPRPVQLIHDLLLPERGPASEGGSPSCSCKS